MDWYLKKFKDITIIIFHRNTIIMMNSPKPEQDTTVSCLPFNDKSGLPWDMKIVLLWTALCIISIYTPVINQSFLRLILVLPLILFIPGYVLLAALFPDSTDIDTIERIVLSIGTSIVITPLIGLCLNFTSWGIRLDPIIISLTAGNRCTCCHGGNPPYPNIS